MTKKYSGQPRKCCQLGRCSYYFLPTPSSLILLLINPDTVLTSKLVHFKDLAIASCCHCLPGWFILARQTTVTITKTGFLILGLLTPSQNGFKDTREKKKTEVNLK